MKDQSGIPSPSKEESASLQHLEWVNFQRSIAVEGFDTGQTTEVQSTKKRRGGKKNKRNIKLSAVEQKIAERQRLTNVGGGQYPPVRYSDEETEKLLIQAYSALPDRGGKRGTKNLKRQQRRWALVRAIRRKYKGHMAEHQIRKMQKRSQKVTQVKTMLSNAPDLQKRDREYQATILKYWATNIIMNKIGKEGEVE